MLLRTLVVGRRGLCAMGDTDPLVANMRTASGSELTCSVGIRQVLQQENLPYGGASRYGLGRGKAI